MSTLTQAGSPFHKSGLKSPQKNSLSYGFDGKPSSQRSQRSNSKSTDSEKKKRKKKKRPPSETVDKKKKVGSRTGHPHF
jgi:hypothetical protein